MTNMSLTHTDIRLMCITLIRSILNIINDQYMSDDVGQEIYGTFLAYQYRLLYIFM